MRNGVSNSNMPNKSDHMRMVSRHLTLYILAPPHGAHIPLPKLPEWLHRCFGRYSWRKKPLSIEHSPLLIVGFLAFCISNFRIRTQTAFTPWFFVHFAHKITTVATLSTETYTIPYVIFFPSLLLNKSLSFLSRIIIFPLSARYLIDFLTQIFISKFLFCELRTNNCEPILIS